jgi:hypothetical protein
MQIDRIPEDMRQYLRAQFGNVQDEASPLSDYYVFSVALPSSQRRTLTVHRYFFIFPDFVRSCLSDDKLAEKLRKGDVKLSKPERGTKVA